MAEKRGSGGSILNFVLRNSLAVGVIVVVLFMFIPLPTAFIDLAMVINLALSFIILLTVIYMKRAADFTSFPRVVLITTIFGLAINISSTRKYSCSSGKNFRAYGWAERNGSGVCEHCCWR